MDRTPFNPLQAQEVAEAFNQAGVEYLFIGKGGAILLGFPGTTQDVGLFPAKSEENGRRIVTALAGLGFELGETTRAEIVLGKDFVQLKSGPFDIDLVFAPDGIESFEEAKARAVQEGQFPVANLRDIIASKKAAGRKKDRLDLELLELFRLEYEARNQ
ncbi:MAG: hypothetical protein H8E20_11880 [Verrucomicrobia bacterium]|nr:hypothetical protein [Verrucomicrobiota bacterium]